MIHNTGTAGRRDGGRSPPLNRGPQPGWMTLNDARERAFTGEIVFEVEPEVRAYLDNGVAYYAERATDAPLGQRLVEAGLVDHAQLERGTVRVGDVEHLGRLFDRDTSVDRDAVLVVTESETEVSSLRSRTSRLHDSLDGVPSPSVRRASVVRDTGRVDGRSPARRGLLARGQRHSTMSPVCRS